MTPKRIDGNISPYKRDILGLLLLRQHPSTTRTLCFAFAPSNLRLPPVLPPHLILAAFDLC